MGKALENNDWDTLRTDLNKLPIGHINGSSSESEIISILNEYGIRFNENQPLKVSIEIWGSGKPMREFLWSEDMADACVFIMENRDFKDTYTTSSDSEIRNTHINIGTGTDIRIKDLARAIVETIGFKGALYFNTEKPDGTLKKLTNSSKLHDLGWKHKIDLKKGIQMMYNHYLK